MKNELYKTLKEINIKALSLDDLEELLIWFKNTKNDLIRNQIAFIFSDLKYNKAVPFIIAKASDKELLNNNGSLVYALANFDLIPYFKFLIKIICEYEYEPRLMAYDILQKIVPKLSLKNKMSGLKILENTAKTLKINSNKMDENSIIHFVEATILLLNEK